MAHKVKWLKMYMLVQLSQWEKIHAKAKRNFAAHSALSANIKTRFTHQMSLETFENNIGDVIRISAPAIEKMESLYENFELRQVLVKVSHTETSSFIHIFLGFAILKASFYSLNSKLRGNDATNNVNVS